ncbi:MAG: hypothetical protein JWR90_3901 [Marmoricola sp.]|nr:hypothetical protein [Marmoricola sp.]
MTFPAALGRGRAPRRTTPIVLSLLLAVAAVLGPVVSVAADPLPTPTLILRAPPSGKAGLPAPFTATLKDSADAPMVGATVTLQRLAGATWTNAGSGTTGSTGQVVINALLPVGATKWRASYAGDTVDGPALSPETTVTGNRYASTLVMTGPARLVDERTGTLGLLWTASDGSPVAGAVNVYRRLGSGAWTFYRRVGTAANGRAYVAVAPRTDSTWRAAGAAGSWWLADVSNDLFVDNVPQTAPVVLPAAAPTPAATPAQARATGAGAHPVISRVPKAVWRSMVGRSWHRGCPVGRRGLRLVQINYWGFDGYRYRGEIVLSSAVARRAAEALRDMYNGRYPIRRMYRVDRFGWSSVLHGANDYASMRADNTSAFNCRSVVNKPRVLSPHARGRAVDLNTWENPYRSATGLVPDSWWAGHSHPRVAWRTSTHPVVRIWRAHGFRWTYANVDSQHLDGRSTTTAVIGTFTG